jgi:hypothetical protein
MKFKVKIQPDFTLLPDKIAKEKLQKKPVGSIWQCELKKDNTRSIPELRLYWVFCTYLADNMPEMILKIFDLEHMSKELVHNLFKSKFNISSVAFDNMNEADFNVYFQGCIQWAADYIIRCKVDDIKDMINEYRDITKV